MLRLFKPLNIAVMKHKRVIFEGKSLQKRGLLSGYDTVNLPPNKASLVVTG